MLKHKELGRFLRTRRESMRVADVGLVAGTRRRTPGLRREEIAVLASISTSYYERLEQGRGENPSEQLIGSLARALRLDSDERAHLYTLAGFQEPPAFGGGGYVDPGLMHLVDALVATPAQISDNLGFVSRAYAGDLRSSAYRQGRDEATNRLAGKLLKASPEFTALWEQGVVGVLRSTRKTLLHAQVGELDVQCDVVISPGTGHRLITWRPQPGSDTAGKLEFLQVLGAVSSAVTLSG